MEATIHLKFPFQFDKTKLQQELALLLDKNWVPHFNKNGYDGEWNSIALYAKDGDETNIFALNANDSKITATPLLNKCPYLQEVIAHFKCPLLSVRLLRLGAGAAIKPHRDHELGYEDGNFRIHIPIFTNPDVDFILDGVRLEMLPGQCWYTNVNYVHAVANNGQTDRIHLVIDGERNEWSDELFFSLAPKESFFPKKEEKYSPDTLRDIIEELKRANTPGAQAAIESLRAGHA